MIWRAPTNHQSDCYFCLTNISGFNRTTKNSITYPLVSSVTFPVLISVEKSNENDIDIQKEESVLEVSTNEVSIEENADVVEMEIAEQEDVLSEPEEAEDREQVNRIDVNSKGYTQDELSDLVRDLGLSKESAELLASRLKEKKFLAPKTCVSFYRDRDLPFREFFSKENSLVYCCNIEGLINKYKVYSYRASDWRLFIDSSMRSLKAVLLHNGNELAPIPVGHSVILNEEYNNLHFLLEKLNYSTHKWQICGDLKIMTILLGQQSGFTKYPCFICEWDSRARDEHYMKKDWPLRQNLTPGIKNIVKESLIPLDKVILPPLHIKLGLIKQLVKAMKTAGSEAFKYILQKFPKLSAAKINEGVFDGPQIRELLKDTEFEKRMTDKEKAAWRSFREVTTKFLGNNKDPDYKNIVDGMLKNFKEVGCLMNLKIHFLHSHIDYFPENLGNFSEEQGERFHQDLKDVEKRYQGVWDVKMMADYCWSLKRDTNTPHKRKAIRRSFATKRTRYHSKLQNV